MPHWIEIGKLGYKFFTLLVMGLAVFFVVFPERLSYKKVKKNLMVGMEKLVFTLIIIGFVFGIVAFVKMKLLKLTDVDKLYNYLAVLMMALVFVVDFYHRSAQKDRIRMILTVSGIITIGASTISYLIYQFHLLFPSLFWMMIIPLVIMIVLVLLLVLFTYISR